MENIFDFPEGYTITQTNDGFVVTLNEEVIATFDDYMTAMLSLPNECFAF